MSTVSFVFGTERYSSCLLRMCVSLSFSFSSYIVSIFWIVVCSSSISSSNCLRSISHHSPTPGGSPAPPASARSPSRPCPATSDASAEEPVEAPAEASSAATAAATAAATIAGSTTATWADEKVVEVGRSREQSRSGAWTRGSLAVCSERVTRENSATSYRQAGSSAPTAWEGSSCSEGAKEASR